jgi:hypothetical protein
MAKKYYKAPVHQTGTSITTKTHFGTDSSMIVDLTGFKPVTISESQIVCKDDLGFYITEKHRIDSKLADPNRYANKKSRIALEPIDKQT